MNQELIEVEHAGVEGSARVPKSALKVMPGWKPVKSTAKKAAAPAKKAAAKRTPAKKAAAPTPSPSATDSKES